MKIKKLLVIPFIALLAFKISDISIKASTKEHISTTKYLYQENFESYDNDLDWKRKAIYLENCTGKITSDSISGEKSLRVDSEAAGWACLKLKPGTVPLQNSEYTLYFECKTHNIML